MSQPPEKKHDSAPPQDLPAEDSTSLDPADWDQFRALCHDMLDEALGHLETRGEGPVWRPLPEEVKEALAEPPPLEPQGPERVCNDFRRLVLPYGTGNTHPRFFGWVHGSGTPGGMLAELLAGALNANLGGREHAPVHVERTVLEWCRQIFGFPQGAGGLLVSGTSMATLIGLTVARNHLAGHDLRKGGLKPEDGRLVAYTSAQAHGSVAKAMEILGLGRDALRGLPVTAGFDMDLAALAEAVAADRAAGAKPFCVIGTAGTVNTGAIDDLNGIAEVCAEEGLWFHVDGAFGAAAVLSEELKPRLAGIERADSLAFDFHKWLHVPYDAGCILVRDGRLQRAAFSSRQEYLTGAERGLAGGNPWFCEYGPELSRGFRALKVWFTLKEHGTARLGAKIAENCGQARDLAALIEAHPRLELLAPVSLNIVCFRYAVPELADEGLDRLNGEIVIALQEWGIAAPSTTRIDGRLAIRVNITNHRSKAADFAALVEAVAALGREFSEQEAAPEFTLPEIAAIDPEAPEEARTAIEAACRRPELRALSYGLTISLDVGLDMPFMVARGLQIVLGAGALGDPALLALLLRHAFELALLQRLTPGAWTGARGALLALLACRTAGFYQGLMIEAERAACRATLPTWLAAAYDATTEERPGALSRERLVPLMAPLLELQGEPATAADAGFDQGTDQGTDRGSDRGSDRGTWRGVWAELTAQFEAVGSLAAPAEYLLTTGGDTRLRLDPATGLNAYGCSPRPRPWAVTFASSTATSISDLAYQEVERLRQGLLSAALLGDLETAYEKELTRAKQALLGFCGAAELAGCEAVLCTSGTDAELYALHFALGGPGGGPGGGPEEQVTNILIAPDETGSGAVQAAGGRHFAPITALGAAVEVGAPLADFAEGRVDVEAVAARDEAGQLRPLEEIDREVEARAEAALDAGRRCLVHLLDCSKTGWGAPSLDCLARLHEKHAARLDVVVDACQMRAGPEALGGYLRRGFMLQVTGSKIFTGPPFSGALVLPPEVAARADTLPPLPESFADYALRTEWPAAWDGLCANLPQSPPLGRNLGLLGRWTAALWEMRAFHAVPAIERRRILERFGSAVLATLEQSEAVAPAVEPVYERGAFSPEGSWDRVTTIFPFTVRRPGKGGTEVTLDPEAARKVYHWLNRDIAAALPRRAPKRAREVAARRCHIGQPVKLAGPGGWTLGALRLCAGARIVSGVAFDPELGATPEQRLEREIADARLVIEKIEVIVRYWKALEKFEAEPPGDHRV